MDGKGRARRRLELDVATTFAIATLLAFLGAILYSWNHDHDMSGGIDLIVFLLLINPPIVALLVGIQGGRGAFPVHEATPFLVALGVGFGWALGSMAEEFLKYWGEGIDSSAHVIVILMVVPFWWVTSSLLGLVGGFIGRRSRHKATGTEVEHP